MLYTNPAAAAPPDRTEQVHFFFIFFSDYLVITIKSTKKF